ncbi:MAG: hypothetical protein JXR86_00945 [Spirochaetales bacterium]|nr:hypothetical protein [Spirochaetales bacterium]
MKIEKKNLLPHGKISRENGPSAKGALSAEKSESAVKIKLDREKIPESDLKSLIGRLKSLRVPAKGSGMPVLISLFSLLETAQPLPGSLDMKIAERFLSLWMEENLSGMPVQLKKGLEDLKAALKNLNWHDEPLYLISGRHVPGMDRSWQLTVRPEGRDPGKNRDEEETLSCRLDFSSSRLGEITVLLEDGPALRSCSFSSSDESVRKLLKKSSSLFRTQLEKHGMEVPRISIHSPLDPGMREHTRKSRERVDLWG